MPHGPRSGDRASWVGHCILRDEGIRMGAFCVSDAGKRSSEEEEPWVFVVEGELLGEWDVDGSWMMLDGIDPPEEVEEMKRAAIAAAKERRRADGL